MKSAGGVIIGGVFEVECYLHGRRLWRECVPNGVTTTALNALSDGFFSGGTVTSSWFLSLITNPATLDPSDTMGSHSGWTENTSYTSATRPAWGHGSASGGIKQNASLVNFTMSASATLAGIFLASNSTKGGSSGTLWAHGEFQTARDVAANSLLPIRYRVIMAAGEQS